MFFNPEILEGKWEFQGYYPKGCKERPICYTNEMGFEINKS